RTCRGSFFSTPSATAVTRMVSVKVGRCRLCCSQAAIGAMTTVRSRGTSRSSGAVISWNFIVHAFLVPTLCVGTHFRDALRPFIAANSDVPGQVLRDAERRKQCVPTQSVGTRKASASFQQLAETFIRFVPARRVLGCEGLDLK